MPPLVDRARLGDTQRRALVEGVAAMPTLERVLAWIRGHPARRLVEILTQDEYTHDVVVAHEGGFFLVFDTT